MREMNERKYFQSEKANKKEIKYTECTHKKNAYQFIGLAITDAFIYTVIGKKYVIILENG